MRTCLKSGEELKDGAIGEIVTKDYKEKIIVMKTKTQLFKEDTSVRGYYYYTIPFVLCHQEMYRKIYCRRQYIFLFLLLFFYYYGCQNDNLKGCQNDNLNFCYMDLSCQIDNLFSYLLTNLGCQNDNLYDMPHNKKEICAHTSLVCIILFWKLI